MPNLDRDPRCAFYRIAAGARTLREAAAKLLAALATPAAGLPDVAQSSATLALPPQPELRTGRLHLSAFRPEDAAAVYAYASDPEVARYVTWAPNGSVAESEAFIRAAVGQPDTHVWAVREGTGEAMRAAPAVGTVEFSLDTPGRGSVHYVLSPAAIGGARPRLAPCPPCRAATQRSDQRRLTSPRPPPCLRRCGPVRGGRAGSSSPPRSPRWSCPPARSSSRATRPK